MMHRQASKKSNAWKDDGVRVDHTILLWLLKEQAITEEVLDWLENGIFTQKSQNAPKTIKMQ